MERKFCVRFVYAVFFNMMDEDCIRSAYTIRKVSAAETIAKNLKEKIIIILLIPAKT